ncbi:hypothetical protein FNU76_16915 [Chitinimonas arctica]|uniref:Uncharacterized protein n=1 Tax=Chitinimonas arctica TaxID=2594795 RepID=A0A516SIB7_9NEIS|nr:hypothetical protein [Chitinimonas arctica]QDQ27892.1 hypothetical protein FNU76_16915 [Chitinimonas arctica]
MFTRLVLLALLSPVAFAAPSKSKAEPIVLADKYSPIFYEHLQGKERTRCEQYVRELTLMAKRQQMGIRPGDATKMTAKRQLIEANYDKYCLRLQK